MERIIYFDLETKYSAEEVGGWENIEDMGMSVGVIWDSVDQQFSVYLDHQTNELVEHCKRSDQIVGFNHVSFDYRVLAGACHAEAQMRSRLHTELAGLNNLDMLVELKKVLGHRLKLESVARSTLGTGKSADGLQALKWYREGQYTTKLSNIARLMLKSHVTCISMLLSMGSFIMTHAQVSRQLKLTGNLNLRKKK